MPNLARQTVKWTAYSFDRLTPKPRGVVVLIYHRVGRRSALEVDLPTDLFDQQLSELAASGRVRSLDAALDILEAPDPPTVDPIVITFDDGTADFAEVAMPRLAHHGLPVTLYVATDFIDRGIDFPDDGHPLSWTTLADCASTGLLTVGSHTHTHALLDRLAPPAITEELDRSDALIAEHLGSSPRHFAYPKAVAGSAAADEAVRRRYRSSALAGTRPNRHGRTDLHRLARSPVQVSDGTRFFAAKIAGGMGLEDALRERLNRWRYRGVTG